MKKINLHYFRHLLGCLLCAFLMHGGAALAQDNTQSVSIKGRVLDETGTPISYSVIGLKGTNTGTTADDNGYFTITLPANTTSGDLVVSFVGYSTKEVHFDGNQTLEITLGQGTKNLNEVVVIGYGTAAVKDLTGSVAVVNEKDFNQGVISTAGELIQGKVAGVVVTPNSGAPGAGSNINIRGTNSISLGTNPLYVIDGVILSQDNISGAPDPLSTIDPANIETFTVLKDPASCAIYGNRASNGVIIITTKKGKGGKLSVDINSITAYSQITKYADVMNANQFRTYVTANGGAANIALLGNSNTDWQKQIYQNALNTSNEINLSGGIKNLPYRLSFSNFDQEGTLKTGYLKRQAVELHVNPSYLDNTLKVSVNLNGTHSESRFANTAAIGDAIHYDPTQSVYSSNPASSWYGYTTWMKSNGAGGYYPNPLATSNPVADLNDKRDISAVNRLYGNIQLDYEIPHVSGLRAILLGGGDVSTGSGYTSVSPYYSGSYAQGGTYDTYKQLNLNKLFDFYFNYKKDFKNIHSTIDATAGYEYQEQDNYAPATIVHYTPSPSGTQTPPYIPTGDSVQQIWISYYARLTYTFYDKYLLTLTDREDYCSNIGGNHGGNFYGASAGWKINEESFLKDVKSISQLKLRVSDAQVGNSAVPAYQYIPNYYQYTNTAQYQLNGTYYQPYSPSAYNTNIKWETVTGANVAIDYGFFNNRITGSIEAYQKTTTNLLNSNVPVSALANLSNVITENIGSLTNKGVEFQISALAVTTKDVNWTVNFNIAYNKNEITSLYGEGTVINTGSISGGTGNTIMADVVGKPVGSFWVEQQVYYPNGKPVEGVYATQANGGVFYADKSSIPPVTLGFSTRLDYKKWELYLSAHADIGNYVYNNVLSNLDTKNTFFNSLNYISNGSMDVYNTKFANSQYLSDYYIQNASFLRMDNITLSYNFGKVIAHKIGITISAICQNAFVITKYQGVNPEVGGIDNNVYPFSRIYSLGVKFHF